ncbi:hypothetical protein T310_8462, partial [Rasamsonia emersonii CBS 393.64]
RLTHRNNHPAPVSNVPKTSRSKKKHHCSTYEREPTPMPVMNRPARMDLGPEALTAVHWMTTPRMKMAVLTRMEYLRLSTSARKPEYSVPNQAPSSRIAVSQPFLVESATYSPMCFPKEVMVKMPAPVSPSILYHPITRMPLTAKNTLVVTVEQTAQARKRRDTDDAQVLEKRQRPRRPGERQPALQGRIFGLRVHRSHGRRQAVAVGEPGSS